MAGGKVVDLRVRPSQWANLSFDTNGIVGESVAQLGLSVTPFDFGTFYKGLLQTVAGHPARLHYDSHEIRIDPNVAASAMVELRAEAKKAVLDKAIATRANAFYAKYVNQAAVIAQTRQFYAAASPGSKPQRLTNLSGISQNQADMLLAAYTADSRLSVVKSTTSDLSSYTDSAGRSGNTTFSNGLSNANNTAIQNGSSNNFSNNSGSEVSVTGGTLTDIFDSSFGSIAVSSSGSTFSNGFSTQNNVSVGCSDSSGTAVQAQFVANTDYGYRVPSLESAAQNERAQISLMDEQYEQFMFGQNLPYLEHVFHNELRSIDLDVKRLQVAYLDTILMSPINGVVTGVYKNPGDRVKVGEPVVRVENNRNVFLIGTLVYRGMVSLGAPVTVASTLFSTGGLTTITGNVIAARGHRSQDDRWEVVLACSNVDGSGNPIFPLHYHFDYDDTQVSI